MGDSVKIKGIEELSDLLNSFIDTGKNFQSKSGQKIIQDANVLGPGLDREPVRLSKTKEDAVKEYDYKLLQQGKNREDGSKVECDSSMLDKAIRDFIEQNDESKGK